MADSILVFLEHRGAEYRLCFIVLDIVTGAKGRSNVFGAVPD